MLLQELKQKKLINPPDWLVDNCQFLTIMGSMAYGVSSDSSDMDIYGFCIPPKKSVFPHLAGKLIGFDKDLGTWDQWQNHHILDQSACAGKGREYDFQIFNIVKFFALLMDNNPNCIDALYTPITCVLHCTKVGNMVRDNRKIFLHKGAWHRFKGYSYSMLHKMSSKNPKEGSKRDALRKEFGFDVKYSYHLVRLLGEVEQILTEGDIDLQRNNEQLKAIRRGEWTEQQIRDYFTAKEKDLEKLYAESKLQHSPDEGKIKQLLIDCLEEHYGNLENCVVNPDKATILLQQIKELIAKNE